MSDAIYNYVTQSENIYYYYYDNSIYYTPINSTASASGRGVPARDLPYESLYTSKSTSVINTSYTPSAATKEEIKELLEQMLPDLLTDEILETLEFKPMTEEMIQDIIKNREQSD